MFKKASEKILNYDKSLKKSTFTFGIIYQKFGQVNINSYNTWFSLKNVAIIIYLQTSEKEIFENNTHSSEFNEFLNFIGSRIKLKNFPG